MRIILNGAQGAMGRELQRILPAAGHEIVAKVDVNGGAYTSMAQVQVPADMVVDFSFHTATAGAVDYALAHNLPIVVGTTGHTEQERAHILLAGEKIPVFYSGNMSLGIAVLCNLVREAVRIFPQADVEILEIHHNRKADAPSGTALMLARAVQSVRPDAVVHCGRAGVGGRLPREIGVASLRMGILWHSRGADLHRQRNPHPEARGPRPGAAGPGGGGKRQHSSRIKGRGYTAWRSWSANKWIKLQQIWGHLPGRCRPFPPGAGDFGREPCPAVCGGFRPGEEKRPGCEDYGSAL